jgi:RND family efflux transporter MFP subunit
MSETPSPASPDPSRAPIGGDSSTPAPRRRFKGLTTVLLALLLAVGVVGGAYWYSRLDTGAASPAAAAAPQAPPPVTVALPIHREIVDWDEFTGQFAAVDYVEVRARVSGHLDSIHFVDGQIVNKGDLLFIIDPRPYEIALASAQAQVADATARLELAKVQLARAEKLRKKDFVAASTYDERIEEMRGATAALEAARAAVRAAELDLEFTRVTAPLGGRVSAHAVSVGNLVTGGSGADNTLLTTIVSLNPIYLVFDMSEAQFLAYQRAIAAGKLKSSREDAVTVFARLADETDWPLEGLMDFVDNQMDRSSGTIRARALFPNSDYFIAPGQFGRLRLPGSEPYNAILVPDEAILTDQSRKIVMTVAEDGTVVPSVVRPGPLHDGLRVIREGLDPSDRIIINGLIRARPGAKVTPEPGQIEPNS